MADLDDDMLAAYDETGAALTALTLTEGTDRFTVVVYLDEQAGTAAVLELALSIDTMATTLRLYRDGDFVGEERLDASR